MDFRAQAYLDQSNSLTEEQKKWVIPSDVYASLENCSLELEELFEFRYGRILANLPEIKDFAEDDPYFKRAFEEERQFLHVSLWVIDHFHVGVLGFDHIFWHMAGKYLLCGIDNCTVENFFDPDTDRFDPDLHPLPPNVFHYLDASGNVLSSKDEFDRSDTTSMQWNFYRGLRSPRAEQRDRFRALFESLESSDFSFDEDDLEPYDFRQWDDPENDVILASLEEVKPTGGRPSNSAQDDRYAVMYSKIFLTRYFGDMPGKIPSRRSCIRKVAEYFDIEDHNLEAFHKRIDRKLKRKMAFRNLGQ